MCTLCAFAQRYQKSKQGVLLVDTRQFSEWIVTELKPQRPNQLQQ